MSDTKQQTALTEFLARYVTENKREKMQAALDFRTDFLAVVLEDIFQPHNASAVLRTCDCYGVQNVHIIENRNSYRVNPQVAMGSAKWLSLHRYREQSADNTRTCLNALRTAGYRLVATTPNVEPAYTPHDLPLDRPVALLFGTEEEGLTEAALDAADCALNIPAFGFTQSYNISVSVAITLTALMHRLHEGDARWKLSEDRRAELLLEWYRQVVTRYEDLERRFLQDGLDHPGTEGS